MKRLFVISTIKILSGLLFLVSVCGIASPNNPVAPMALLQKQVVIERLLGIQDEEDRAITDIKGDLLTGRLLAPWNEQYISDNLDTVRRRVEAYFEYECPETLAENELKDSSYIWAEGTPVLASELTELKNSIDWSEYRDQYDASRRVVIVESCNVHRFPNARLITKQLDQTSNVASDNKNNEDLWFSGQPAYIVATTKNRHWLLLMSGIDTLGWVAREHVATVSDDQCKQLKQNLMQVHQPVYGFAGGEANWMGLLHPGSLLVGTPEGGYQLVYRKAVMTREGYGVCPAVIVDVQIYNEDRSPLSKETQPFYTAKHVKSRRFFLDTLNSMLGSSFAWGAWTLEDQKRLSFDTSKFVEMAFQHGAGVKIQGNTKHILSSQAGDLFKLDYVQAVIRTYPDPAAETESHWIVSTASAAGVVDSYALPDSAKQIEVRHSKALNVHSPSTDQKIKHRQNIVHLIMESGKLGDAFGFTGGIFIYLGHTTKGAIREQAIAEAQDQGRVNEFFPEEDDDQPILLMAGCPLGGRPPESDTWYITGCSHIFGISPKSKYFGRWLDKQVYLVRPFKKTALDEAR